MTSLQSSSDAWLWPRSESFVKVVLKLDAMVAWLTAVTVSPSLQQCERETERTCVLLPRASSNVVAREDAVREETELARQRALLLAYSSGQ